MQHSVYRGRLRAWRQDHHISFIRIILRDGYDEKVWEEIIYPSSPDQEDEDVAALRDA